MPQFINVNGVDIPMERLIEERKKGNNKNDLEVVLVKKTRAKSKKK
jgi:hypothetical protein